MLQVSFQHKDGLFFQLKISILIEYINNVIYVPFLL